MFAKFVTRAVLCSALSAMASAAAAADVVVGSVDGITGEATLMTDLFKTTFPDGGPILRVSVKARTDISNGFLLVRAGRTASGTCHTEVTPLGVDGDRVTLSLTPVLMFNCDEIEERCRPEGMYPVLCMPDITNTTCQCRPGFAAAPSETPRCEKTYALPWPLRIEDILWRIPN